VKRHLFHLVVLAWMVCGVLFGLSALSGLMVHVWGPESLDEPFTGPLDPRNVVTWVLVIPFVLIGIAGVFMVVVLPLLLRYPGITPSGNARDLWIVRTLAGPGEQGGNNNDEETNQGKSGGTGT
jgi:hypothetical protein